jgi:simple sugar transport system permease protein
MSVKLGLLILGALAVLGLALASTGVPVSQALSEVVRSSLGTERGITGTLRETTPLLFAGLAVYLALQAGLFNIGVEGQFLMGALVCAVSALVAKGPVGIVVGLLAGTLAGIIWAFPAGWIKAYRGGHEVITTIMLNNAAMLFATALVAGPLKAPDQESPSTAVIAADTRLPNLINQPKLQVNLGLLLGLVATYLFARWLAKTVAGYELRAAGANPVAARSAGVEVRPTILRAMLLSGGIAGMGGAVMVLAFEGRFYQGFSAGYGFDGLGVALLAGGSPLGLLPSALLFGILNKGGTAVQFLGVPKGLTYVLLGLLIVIAAAIRYQKGGRDGHTD